VCVGGGGLGEINSTRNFRISVLGREGIWRRGLSLPHVPTALAL
jgi:hypothetical protein